MHHHTHGSQADGADSLRHGSCLEHGAAHEHDHALWSRRDFLTRIGAAAAGFAFMMGSRPMQVFGKSLPPHPVNLVASDRVLVLVQLSGGNDGLNTVIPVGNDIYYQRRPTIAIPKAQALLLDDETGLHPAMQGLMPLWDDGKMAVVHNVGYANQTRSHFRGTDIWVTGTDADTYESTGWAGRYLADEYTDILNNPPDYPLAVRVGGAPATLFQSRYGNLGMTFADSAQFQRFVAQGGFYDVDDVPGTVYGQELSFVRSVTNAAYRYVQSVQTAASKAANLGTYPNSSLASSLSVVARLIRGDLGSSFYTVSQGGFDTHSNQGGPQGGHANNLADVANSVAAFLADLASDGLDRQVIVMTFSEFGRTLNENGSRGTDHGAGAPMLLFGTGLNGGLYGTQSDLVNLYGGDPKYTTDYRRVYSTLLQNWFGMEAAGVQEVLEGGFTPFDLVNPAATVRTEAPVATGNLHLDQNYPNPFSTSTEIRFGIRAAGHVSLAVFDAQGRRVATLVDGTLPAGSHTVSFRPESLASGTYLYRLETRNGVRSRGMALVH
ncbi:MAG TPA: DUF1501 domain-containing protein [Rhodothermales bacterium]|nr:DUF1501 domain-containing protein [Rhodothermales bacterium]